MDIKILEDLQKTFHEFKSVNDQAVEEVKKFGSVSSDLQSKITAMQTRMDASEATLTAQYKAENSSLITRLDRLEAVLHRKSFAYGDAKAEANEKVARVKEVFFKGLRTYNKEPSQIYTQEEMTFLREAKTMILGNDTSGGFLSPLEYVQEVLTETVEYSPIRTLARIRTTTRAGIQMPKKTGNASSRETRGSTCPGRCRSA